VKIVFAKMVKKISVIYFLMMVIVAIYELNDPECMPETDLKPMRKLFCKMQSPSTMYYMILINFVCLSVLIIFLENINESSFQHYLLG
jgi:hypothetical protein